MLLDGKCFLRLICRNDQLDSIKFGPGLSARHGVLYHVCRSLVNFTVRQCPSPEPLKLRESQTPSAKDESDVKIIVNGFPEAQTYAVKENCPKNNYSSAFWKSKFWLLFLNFPSLPVEQSELKTLSEKWTWIGISLSQFESCTFPRGIERERLSFGVGLSERIDLAEKLFKINKRFTEGKVFPTFPPQCGLEANDHQLVVFLPSSGNRPASVAAVFRPRSSFPVYIPFLCLLKPS